jgi:hypothetical protein
MHPDTNETENAMFRACTEATLGNSHKLQFWTDGWLGGRNPKELVPTLYNFFLKKRQELSHSLRREKNYNLTITKY